MKRRIKSCLVRALSLLLVPVLIIVPIRVSGEVRPITEMEDKLEGISEEEKAVLEELFAISQEIEVMERKEAEINDEIDTLQVQITDIQNGIEEKQKDYDFQLDILEKVLVNYQRGGPASYLEILLSADNLTEFLKSINIIKDISRNVGELLVTLEEVKKVLQEEKDKLDEKASLLELKKVELQENLHKNQLLKQEQEEYLASLQEKKVFYQEQLVNLETMWKDSLELFTDIVGEITRIVGAGYFTLDDLNLNFGFTKMHGAILEDTFNNILKENSNLSETTFHFQSKQVVIEVPEKHLVLTGDFILAGETAILFVVKEGSFFDMPLEAASIEELFKNGPLLIDFKKITGDMIILDFTLTQVVSQEGKLTFEIKPKW